MNSFYSNEELQSIGFKQIGKNVLLSRNAQIYNPDNICIGDNVRIDDFCILSGNIQLGRNIHISAYSALFGGSFGIIMNDYSTLSSRCVIYALTDDYSGEYMTNPTITNEYRNVTGGLVTIGKHVIIGTGCTILPAVTLEEGVAVGSMSLVTKDLYAWGIYVGIPCKKIKDRKKALLQYEPELQQGV